MRHAWSVKAVRVRKVGPGKAVPMANVVLPMANVVLVDRMDEGPRVKAAGQRGGRMEIVPVRTEIAK